MKLDNSVEGLKVDPLEYSRQTGRSFRMMEAAKASCAAGKPTVVVFKDERDASVWREEYKDVPGLAVIPMKVKMPELDWSQLKFVKGPYAFHETFIDHDAIFSWNKTLIRAYHEYDRPMDQPPYLELKQEAA